MASTACGRASGGAALGGGGHASWWRKVRVLCGKDFADLFKNPTMLIMCLFPIAFMLLYRFMFGQSLSGVEVGDEQAAVDAFLSGFLLVSALCFTTGMVTTMTVIYGIAEEKEKHTLRTLMLANVSAGQVMASRGIVSLVSSAAVMAACYLLTGADLGQLPAFLLVGLLAAAPVMLLSLVVGLASRDQMTSGLYGMPLMLVCIVPMMAVLGTLGEGVATVARFLPNGGAVELLKLLLAGQLLTADAIVPLATSLAWMAAGVLLFALLFKRLTRDN